MYVRAGDCVAVCRDIESNKGLQDAWRKKQTRTTTLDLLACRSWCSSMRLGGGWLAILRAELKPPAPPSPSSSVGCLLLCALRPFFFSSVRCFFVCFTL